MINMQSLLPEPLPKTNMDHWLLPHGLNQDQRSKCSSAEEPGRFSPQVEDRDISCKPVATDLTHRCQVIPQAMFISSIQDQCTCFTLFRVRIRASSNQNILGCEFRPLPNERLGLETAFSASIIGRSRG